MKTAVLISLLLFSALLAAATLQVGSPLPVLTLKDQHDAPQTVTPGTHYLIFAAERTPSAVVETALDGQTAQTLDAAKVRYVADISGMPGLVAAAFALPKMRKRPYPMLLGRTAAETAMLPRAPGKVTLMESVDGTITSVRFIGDAVTLRTALGFVY
ncbi:hypothetical protein [uncultured Thiodictyon sp.]|uniref:hypothetical protein n=1 Tax=uncultured Thiodictyon sp. TaxID=1846217 RepID=UPI0025F623E6|nr:hypothetical protein [uncultured Thiodictyon sp.]